jgi:K+-sensing histidine kinase KdpD
MPRDPQLEVTLEEPDLGLAICRRIVQEHGGTIEITSAVAQGTTVRIQLPVRNGTNGSFLKTDP